MIDISEKLKVFIGGHCNHLGELRSRSQFAKAMWCIDEMDWPAGEQELKQLNQKEKQDDN